MFRQRLIQCLKPRKVVRHTWENRNTCLKDYHLIVSNTTILCRSLQTSVITSNHIHVPEDRENYLSRNDLKERDFLLKVKDDPDLFGSGHQQEIDDEGDKLEEQFFEEQPLPTQKLSTKQYADIIKRLISKRKIKEAIDVLEVRMIKDDRHKPDAYIYNLILGACGRVGYTKKAFSLYNRMKQRGLKAMGGTYTALFNACANSPWPEDGLTRATHLRNIMIEKGDEPNGTTYNAMIKAFGRCGDIKTAFKLVDEMTSKRMAVREDTYNFLLQASITDKTAGFRHALLIWRKLSQKRINPNVYTYNLMLRCIRDCGLGDIETTKDVIDRLLSTNKKPQLKSGISDKDNEIQLIENKQEDTESVSVTSKKLPNTYCRPNLMARFPTLGNIVSLSEITKPEDRLLLVGGLKGFLGNMAENNCAPDIKTFTLLLDSIPNTVAAENDLLKDLKKSNVKPDVDFYNMLIKRRCMRCDYNGAKEAVELLKSEKKRPDLITYGVLALSCKTKSEALDLVEEMRNCAYRLNAQILGALLHQACYNTDFPYVLKVMELCVIEEVKPNKKFMDELEKFRRKCKDMSNDKECKYSTSRSFQKGFKLFRERYSNWLKEIQIDDTEDEHPWHQYRTPNENDAKYYKDTADHFKPRHTSLFKQKTAVIEKPTFKRPHKWKKPATISDNVQKNKQSMLD